MVESYGIVINGGGMVGMSLAIALARNGIHVAMAERTALPSQLEPQFDGRVSAIAHGSMRILDGIGIWEHLKTHAEPILDIRVCDGAVPFFLHYDHSEVGSAPFGYIAENRHIRTAMQQATSGLENLTILENYSLKSIERSDSHIDCRFENGHVIRAQLLIGADGKHSTVRNLADIGLTEWGYKQTAIVATIEHEKPHQGLAQERFLKAGPFAVLPMQHNRSSLVWVEPADRAPVYLELAEAEFVQEIKERLGDYLGAIKIIGPRFSYPLSLSHARSYTAHRIALIGDAAHAIHPIAGQGVNLGFRDVAVMAELLTERFRLGLDIGGSETLSAYQKWRMFDNVTMLAVTDGLNRLFGIDLLPVQLARGLGMWTVGKIPPLKRLFMHHAMGLVGDLPEIVKQKTRNIEKIN